MTTMRCLNVLSRFLLLLAWLQFRNEALAFVLSPSSPSVSPIRRGRSGYHNPRQTQAPDTPNLSFRRRSRSTLSAVPAIIQSALPLPRAVRASILFAAALALALNVRRVLWPGSSPDRSRPEPLPPGPLGCPFFGQITSLFFGGGTSDRFGAGYFYHRLAGALGFPPVWKFYLLGRPHAVVSGGQRVSDLLNREFDPDGLTNGLAARGGNLSVKYSMLGETDRKRYAFLRRLVGMALTPSAVSAAVPNLREAAELQVRSMVASSEPVKMEDICTDYTLDVAWRQILGLNLQGEEIPVFKKAVNDWIGGFFDIRAIIGIGMKSTPSHKALQHLRSKINDKIDDLKRNGSDASTLSGMVFAIDEDDPSGKKLSRQEVIDNALLLILAGSETSASTLTNAMLLLGLHPNKWGQLRQEQSEMQARHGDDISKEILDSECPYLEGVIKESMRMKPIGSGSLRVVNSTLTVEGKQIPEGWGVEYNVLLTHELDPVTYREDWSHMDVKRGFRPERWLSEDTRPSTDFIPMGAGPRYCLGATLAYTEMKVFLAVLARRIDFTLLDTGDIKWKKLSIIPKPADGVPVMATARVDDLVTSS